MADWDYKVVIGLEVHVELKTATKLFCACANEFGAEPNIHVCPVCLGMPGVLPVLNGEAVEMAVRAGMALDCTIRPRSKFDRKQYFYPDLPKAYQISQYDLPFAEHGGVAIPVEDGFKTIRIRRIHLEEDAGKLNHLGQRLKDAQGSLVDLNRAGVPLIEIVSEPDLASAEEARQYLAELRAVLSYLDVSDLRMEEGSMRCDANVSLRPPDYEGRLEDLPRVEVKNVNSIRNVGRAIEFEVARQAELLRAGARVLRETRGFDDSTGRTYSQRSKEEENDYRYFPEPDLPPLVLEDAWLENMRQELPTLPRTWREILAGWGIPARDVETLVRDRAALEYLLAVKEVYDDDRQIVIWMLGDVSRLLNAAGRSFAENPVPPVRLAELLVLIGKGAISGRMAKDVLEAMFTSGETASEVVARLGLSQITDEGRLRAEVEAVVGEHAKVVDDYRAGKEKALGFLVGQVMKRTRGQASPEVVNRLLREVLREA